MGKFIKLEQTLQVIFVVQRNKNRLLLKFKLDKNTLSRFNSTQLTQNKYDKHFYSKGLSP